MIVTDFINGINKYKDDQNVENIFIAFWKFFNFSLENNPVLIFNKNKYVNPSPHCKLKL